MIGTFAAAAISVSAFAQVDPAPPITFDSLLRAMADRSSRGIATEPLPSYTCKQASSYDRASTSADDPKTWFANGDAGQFIRTEKHGDRTEHVMLDADGPGAIVRIWSANPKGVIRIYLDGAADPVIEAPMTDLLGGKWKLDASTVLGEPLSGVQARGWNFFLPIPYAKHCLITSDEGGFYYQVNYCTYKTSRLVSFSMPMRDTAPILRLQESLQSGDWTQPLRLAPRIAIAPGKSAAVFDSAGPNSIEHLALGLWSSDIAAALRSTILVAEFDGEQTIWAPLADFFSQVGGISPFADRYRRILSAEYMESAFPMPFQKRGTVRILNLGPSEVSVAAAAMPRADGWTPRSMHFHASWHMEYPIHTLAGRGTRDWNYVTIKGKGVYVGDSLAVMNPVPEWWGEGDEKIYVDGEAFPSHFGTGTEDYYGFAWCDPHIFQHPFHAQPRCDGNGKNNWGHTTVSRVRSLDAIPFEKSLKFDMEVWHWAACDVAYAATTYWYALPGARCSIKPDPEGAAKPIPQPPLLPPPFKIAGAIECESMKVSAKSDGLTVGPQDMDGFGRNTWSGDSHLWVQGRKVGDFVELTFKPEGDATAPRHLVLFATRSWDYGIIKFAVNGKPAGPAEGIDLFSGQHGKAVSTGPIALGTFTPDANGEFMLHGEVVGRNGKSDGTGSFFGLDCVVVETAAKP